MGYSKGISWIDDTRIPFVDETDPSAKRYQSYRNVENLFGGYGDTKYEYKEQQGRFTPNLLVCDDVLNDGNIVQYNKNRKDNGSYLGGHREEFIGTENNLRVNKIKGQFFNDKGSNSKYYDIDLWFNKLIYGLQ